MWINTWRAFSKPRLCMCLRGKGTTRQWLRCFQHLSPPLNVSTHLTSTLQGRSPIKLIIYSFTADIDSILPNDHHFLHTECLFWIFHCVYMKTDVRFVYRACPDAHRHAEGWTMHSNTKQMASEGQKPTLMAARCFRCAVWLRAHVLLHFLQTDLLSVKSKCPSTVFPFTSVLLDFKGILLNHLTHEGCWLTTTVWKCVCVCVCACV